MDLTTRFSGTRPLSVTQDRYGNVIMAQGHGVRPARWNGDLEQEATDAGIDAPATAPTIVLSSEDPLYYVARIDVTNPGACYYAPPVVTLSGDDDADPKAELVAYLNQSGVYEVLVKKGGKGYPAPPSATLSDTHGKNAELKAILAGPKDDEENSPYTGITHWEVIEQPAGTTQLSNCPIGDSSRFVATNCVNVDLPIDGDGEFTIQSTYAWIIKGGGTLDGSPEEDENFTRTLAYSVEGCGEGTGAVLRLQWDGAQWVASFTGALGATTSYWQGATVIERAEAHKFGVGFSATDPVRVTIDSIVGDASTIVIEGYTAGSSQNTKSQGYAISRIEFAKDEDDADKKGEGFTVAPLLKVTSNSGFGAYATCQVADGQISEVKLENGGGGYRTPPAVEIQSGGAEAFVVARPHLRGKYQCYYRYVDDTPESKGGPIPSNLSPVHELDAGEGSSSALWTVPTIPEGLADRVTHIELWRSTSNQAKMLYRVATVEGAPNESPPPDEGSQYEDSLTDDELRDPDRSGYAAMPIVLPNGMLNANRFTPPPDDKAVVVRFQDRFWYGVDTSGDDPNVVYFSEVDEPESVPDVNEVVVQQNAAQADSLRAIIPFGPTLLLMQSRHAFSLSFSRQPVLDAQVSPIAYRGALNQRCWGIHDGTCYVMDQYGVYSLSAGGEVIPLSEPIADQFATKVDFSKRDWPFISIDPTTNVLRAFVAYKGEDTRAGEDSDGFPTRAMCYSIAAKTWWFEKYPASIRSGTHSRLDNGDFRCVYATELAESGMHTLDEGNYDISSGSIVEVRLTECGSGYRDPPAVTVSGGVGAQLQASVNVNGEVTAIWILSPGFGYEDGSVTISPPDDANGVQAAATFVVADAAASLYPSYRFKSGCLTYPSDTDDPKAAATTPRAISMLYKPQSEPCEVSLRTYYNNSPHPAPNAAPRDRGIGFSFDAIDNAARLDLSAYTRKYGQDTGVARALLAGRLMDETAAADRNVSVELAGASSGSTPVEFYGLDVGGTAK